MGKTLACLALMPGTVCQAASQTPFALGVLNHRSLQATAACWIRFRMTTAGIFSVSPGCW